MFRLYEIIAVQVGDVFLTPGKVFFTYRLCLSMSPSVPEANILQSLQPFFRKLTHSYLGSCSQSALNLAEGLPIFLIFASLLLPLSQLSPFSAKSWVGQENERGPLFARSLIAHEGMSGSRLSATTSLSLSRGSCTQARPTRSFVRSERASKERASLILLTYP